MQVLISSSRPSRALFTHSGSASIGRAIDTRSASPRASTDSATSGMLMRLLVITGTVTTWRSRPVTDAKAARGTMVAMVGTGASCQQKCVLRMLAPAASTARASVTISSQASPPSSMSIAEMRKIRMKSGPTAARTRRTTSTGKRMRCSNGPPQGRCAGWSFRTRKVDSR